jgi:hypothetical protein
MTHNEHLVRRALSKFKRFHGKYANAMIRKRCISASQSCSLTGSSSRSPKPGPDCAARMARTVTSGPESGGGGTPQGSGVFREYPISR